MNQSTRSLLEIHVAVFLFGLAGLFGKFIHQSSAVIVFGRVLFASIALLGIIRLSRLGLGLKSAQDYMWFALLGIILAVHWTTFFYAVQVSSVAIGLLSFSTFPVFTTFLEPIAFKERLKPINIAIALVTLLGVGLIIPSFDVGNNVTQGVIWGVVSGFTFAVLAILNRKYVEAYPSLLISFYQDGVAALVLLPIAIIQQPAFSWIDIVLLIVLGVFCTAIAHTLFIKGMSSVKAQLASVIASLEPVYGIIFAALLLSEIPTLRTVLGGVIILSATLFATTTAEVSSQ